MYERIMIVVEEGTIARAAVDEGLALARCHASELLFFHVLPNYVVPTMDMPPMVGMEPEEFRQSAEQAAARVLAAAGARADELGLKSSGAVGSASDAAEAIAHAASNRQCQLIVIGSHGRTALQRLVFGSVVTRLITLSPVPVLVCKRPDTRLPQPDQRVDDPDAQQPASPLPPA